MTPPPAPGDVAACDASPPRAIDIDQSIRTDQRYIAAMSSDAPAPPLCPECHEPMKLVKTLSHLSGVPEIFVFYCSRCKQAEIKVQERSAA